MHITHMCCIYSAQLLGLLCCEPLYLWGDFGWNCGHCARALYSNAAILQMHDIVYMLEGQTAACRAWL